MLAPRFRGKSGSEHTFRTPAHPASILDSKRSRFIINGAVELTLWLGIKKKEAFNVTKSPLTWAPSSGVRRKASPNLLRSSRWRGTSRKVAIAAAPGWTLVELSVVVAVLGILTVLGLNALQDTTRRVATAGALDELFASIRVVRQEARERSVPVVFQLGMDEDGSRMRYRAFLLPDFVPGDTIEAPEEPNDEAWLFKPRRLPPELGLREPPTESGGSLPPPFDSLLGSASCSFCSEGEEVTLVYLSDESLALGSSPEDHQAGGSFTVGRWGRSEDRVAGQAPPEHHHFLLLGRTGSVHRFAR